MQITLSLELENALIQRAQQVGVAPDQLAMDLLRQQLNGLQFSHEKTQASFLDGYAEIIHGAHNAGFKNKPRSPISADELLQIGRRCASLPVLDHRSADEILGYNQNGLLD